MNLRNCFRSPIIWYKEPGARVNVEIELLKSNYSFNFEQHDFVSAIKCLETLQAFGPFEDVELMNKIEIKWMKCHYMMAKDHWRNKQYSDAMYHFTAILTKDITKASVYYYIAMYYQKTQEDSKALYNINKAIVLAPEIVKYQQVRSEIKGYCILDVEHNLCEYKFENTFSN